VEKDTLKCVSCGVFWKIESPESWLSVPATKKLTSILESQLGRIHKEHCDFYYDARSYEQERNNQLTDPMPSIVSSMFAPLWPVDLFESPKDALYMRWSRMVTTMPNSVAPFSVPVSPEALTQVLKAFQSLEGTDAEESRDSEMDMKALQLTLYGWSKSEGDFLHCTICKATLEPSKKRPLDVMSLNERHRPYCPFMCGFPWKGDLVATPLPEFLINSVVKELEQGGQETATEKSLAIRTSLKFRTLSKGAASKQ